MRIHPAHRTLIVFTNTRRQLLAAIDRLRKQPELADRRSEERKQLTWLRALIVRRANLSAETDLARALFTDARDVSGALGSTLLHMSGQDPVDVTDALDALASVHYNGEASERVEIDGERVTQR